MNITALFHRPATAPPRHLTRGELNDIARLEQAIAIHRPTIRALEAIGIVDARIKHDPIDSASQIAWLIEQLEESICEIRRQPEMERDD